MPRNGLRDGQQSLRVKWERGSFGEAVPFSLAPRRGGRLLSAPAVRVPPALGRPADPFPPRRAERSTTRGTGDPASSPGCRCRVQAGHNRLGMVRDGPRRFWRPVRILLGFGFIQSGPSAGVQARGARGSASDTCEGAATACGAPAPGRAGRAKVQVWPSAGAGAGDGEGGSRAQEASAFKGPARPGRGFQHFFLEGTAPKLDLEYVWGL